MPPITRERFLLLGACTGEELAAIARDLGFQGLDGKPWANAEKSGQNHSTMPSPAVRAAFNALGACGVPLARTRLGVPLLGGKSVGNGPRVETHVIKQTASTRQGVVWADTAPRIDAAVTAIPDNALSPKGYYVLGCRDRSEALTLAALLNSDLASAWLRLVAEPTLDGRYRYPPWTIALLPIPRDWATACRTLPKIAERAISGAVSSRVLLDAVLRAYGVRLGEVAPLLTWADQE